MSVEQFSAALKDAAYKSWFAKSKKNILVSSVESLRAGEQKANKTSFMLRTEDIAKIAEKLAGRPATSEELKQITDDLKTLRYGVSKRSALVVGSGKDQYLYYPRIDFDNISTVLKRGFDSLPKTTVEEKGVSREARIGDFFHKGHVIGVASNTLEQTISNLKSSNTSSTALDALIPVLEGMLEELRKQDIETSNIGSLDFPLYAKYSKNKNKYLVEMQLGHENISSGQAIAPLTNALRRYFKPENYVQLNKFFRERAGDDAFIQKLITTKGSPSFLDLIEQEILNTLKGKSTSNTTYAAKTLLDVLKIDISSKELNSQVKQDIEKLQNIIKGLKDQKRKLRKPTGQFISLTSIQSLINRGLADQLQKNMGKGNAKSILNYRTGRFANSAQVDRLQITRDGTILAFYSYMKSPYQTFEPGFAQGFPESRDPRRIISKSIRELAAEAVTNRLKAVSV